MAEKLTRRQMREQLYRLTFQLDFHSGEEWEAQAQLFLEDLPSLSLEDREELLEKYRGIRGYIAEIDKMIDEKSSGWTISRLPKADLTVLRVGVYEICYDEKVPDGVAVNEAVELAKQYGGEKSTGYINGVLAAIVRERSLQNG